MAASTILAAARECLQEFGFGQSHETVKLKEFTSDTGAVAVYVLSRNQVLSVIFDPVYAGTVRGFGAKNSLKVTSEFYHNSNMRKFPLRIHGGKKATRHGVKIEFPEPGKLRDCLSLVLGR